MMKISAAIFIPLSILLLVCGCDSPPNSAKPESPKSENKIRKFQIIAGATPPGETFLLDTENGDTWMRCKIEKDKKYKTQGWCKLLRPPDDPNDPLGILPNKKLSDEDLINKYGLP